MEPLRWLLSIWWLPMAAHAIASEKLRTVVDNCFTGAEHLIAKASQQTDANTATKEAVLESLNRNFPTTCNWVARSAGDAKDRLKRKFFSDGFLMQDEEGRLMNTKESDMTDEQKAAVKDIRNVAIGPVLLCVRRAMASSRDSEDAELFRQNFGDGSDKALNEVLFEVVRNIRCGKKIDAEATNPYEVLKAGLTPTWLEIVEKIALKLAPFVICFSSYSKRGLSIRDAFGCNDHWEWWNHGRDCMRAAQASPDGKVPEEFKKIKIPDKPNTLTGGSSTGVMGKIWSLFYDKFLCGKKGSSKIQPAAVSNVKNVATTHDSKQATPQRTNPRRKRRDDDDKDCNGWFLVYLLAFLGMCGGLIGGGVIGGTAGSVVGVEGGCAGAAACGAIGIASGFVLGAFISELTCK